MIDRPWILFGELNDLPIEPARGEYSSWGRGSLTSLFGRISIVKRGGEYHGCGEKKYVEILETKSYIIKWRREKGKRKFWEENQHLKKNGNGEEYLVVGD